MQKAKPQHRSKLHPSSRSKLRSPTRSHHIPQSRFSTSTTVQFDETYPSLDPNKRYMTSLIAYHTKPDNQHHVLPHTFTQPFTKHTNLESFSEQTAAQPRYNPKKKSLADLHNSLRQWIADSDGFVHPHISFDPSQGGGFLIASKPIPKGTLLGSLPLELSMHPMSKSPPPQNLSVIMKLKGDVQQSTLDFYNSINDLHIHFFQRFQSNQTDQTEMTGDEPITETAQIHSALRLMAELCNYHSSFYKPYLDTIQLDAPQAVASWPQSWTKHLNTSLHNPFTRVVKTNSTGGHTNTTIFTSSLQDINPLPEVSVLEQFLSMIQTDPQANSLWGTFIRHSCNNGTITSFQNHVVAGADPHVQLFKKVYNYILSHSRPLASKLNTELHGLSQSLREVVEVMNGEADMRKKTTHLPTVMSHEPYFGQFTTPSLQPNISFKIHNNLEGDSEHEFHPITQIAHNKADRSLMLYPDQYLSTQWFATRDIQAGEVLTMITPQFHEFPSKTPHPTPFSPRLHSQSLRNALNKAFLDEYPVPMPPGKSAESKEFQTSLATVIEKSLNVNTVLRHSATRYPWLHVEAGASLAQNSSRLSHIFGPLDEYLTFSTTPLRFDLHHILQNVDSIFKSLNSVLIANMFLATNDTKRNGASVVNKQQLLQYLTILQTTINASNLQCQLEPFLTSVLKDEQSQRQQEKQNRDWEKSFGIDPLHGKVSANLIKLCQLLSSFTRPSNTMRSEWAKISRNEQLSEEDVQTFNLLIQTDLSNLIKLSPAQLQEEMNSRQQSSADDQPTALQQYGAMFILLAIVHNTLNHTLKGQEELDKVTAQDSTAFPTEQQHQLASKAFSLVYNLPKLPLQHVFNSLATKLGIHNHDFFPDESKVSKT